MQIEFEINGVKYLGTPITPQPAAAPAPAVNSVDAVNDLLAQNAVEDAEEAAPSEAKFTEVVKSVSDDKPLGYCIKIGPSSGKMWLMAVCWTGLEVATGKLRFGLRFLSKLSNGQYVMTGRVQWNFDKQFTDHKDNPALNRQFIYYQGVDLPTDPAILAMHSKTGCRTIKGFPTVKFEKPIKRTRRKYGKR